MTKTTPCNVERGAEILGPPRSHRAGLGKLRVARQRLIALAADSVERDASFRVGVNAPAIALAEPRPAQACLPFREEIVAGETSYLFDRPGTKLPAWRRGREHHVIGGVLVGCVRNHLE